MKTVSELTWSNLNDIRSDNVDTLQSSNNRTKLSRGPSTSLRRTRSGSESRVQRIDINGEIDWILMSDTIMDLLDDSLRTNGINLTSLRDLEATVPIVLIIGKTGKSGADSSVHVRIIAKQTFLMRMEEVRAVVDRSLLTGCSTEDFGFPGVQVGVEVDDCDGTVGAVHAPEQGKRDGVVSSEGDHTWKGLAVLGDTWFLGSGCWISHQDAVVALFDLVKGPGVVVGGHWDVTAVDDLGPVETSEHLSLHSSSRPEDRTHQSANGFAANGTL